MAELLLRGDRRVDRGGIGGPVVGKDAKNALVGWRRLYLGLTGLRRKRLRHIGLPGGTLPAPGSRLGPCRERYASKSMGRERWVEVMQLGLKSGPLQRLYSTNLPTRSGRVRSKLYETLTIRIGPGASKCMETNEFRSAQRVNRGLGFGP